MTRSFASDNYAGAHPKVLEALAAANAGHVPSYGHDPLSREVSERLAAWLGVPDASVSYVLTGTGANVLAFRVALQPWEAVVCARSAHVNVDEGGAPERLAGTKLIPLDTPDGKLTPPLIEAQVIRVGDEHFAQPRLVTISQSTEYGTVYSLEELEALTASAHAHGLLVHLDGARLGNAAASLGVTPARMIGGTGIDLVSLGATKAGALLAEALVVCDPARAVHVAYLRKQTAQLASKSRFVAAQFGALLEDDLWLELAAHANGLARRLGERARAAEGVEVTQAVDANVVFARVPPAAVESLQAVRHFYVWNERTSECRWMVAWDSTEEDVEAFGDALERVVAPPVMAELA